MATLEVLDRDTLARELVDTVLQNGIIDRAKAALSADLTKAAAAQANGHHYQRASATVPVWDYWKGRQAYRKAGTYQPRLKGESKPTAPIEGALMATIRERNARLEISGPILAKINGKPVATAATKTITLGEVERRRGRMSVAASRTTGRQDYQND